MVIKEILIKCLQVRLLGNVQATTPFSIVDCPVWVNQGISPARFIFYSHCTDDSLGKFTQGDID